METFVINWSQLLVSNLCFGCLIVFCAICRVVEAVKCKKRIFYRFLTIITKIAIYIYIQYITCTYF